VNRNPLKGTGERETHDKIRKVFLCELSELRGSELKQMEKQLMFEVL
jgi:hypothetical protein